jgi:hypothetical protein
MQGNYPSSGIMTLTQTVFKRGNQILHLVLQRKPFADEIIDEVRAELEKRLYGFLQSIIPKLQNIKFSNPEQSLKIIILNAIIKILNQMIKEDIIKLNENDLLTFYNMVKNEEMKFVDEEMPKNNENEINKPENKPQIKKKNLLDKILSWFS